MRVTFDSNSYRQVVDPARAHRDASVSELQKIHDALKDGRISGYLSETVATLEGIQNAQRGPYFASMRPTIELQQEELPGGVIKLGIVMKPNDGLHPGLHPIVTRWLTDAVALGIKFLRAPRIGAPRPTELLANVFEIDADESQQAQRQGRFFDLGQKIESRRVGIAVVKALGNGINVRLGVAKPWFASLDQPIDIHEENRVKRAISEWADGDTVAAHYGYENDYLCSRDRGGSGDAPSIFDTQNRAWVVADHGIQFVTLPELATMV